MNEPRKVRRPINLERKEPEKPVYTKDFIIGYFIGESVWHYALPTLSCDHIRSGRVIQISEEDAKLEETLSDKWFNTPVSDKELRNERWEEYRAVMIHIERKYLPETVTHYFDIHIEMNDEVFKGLEVYLWDTDGCSYCSNKKDILIEDSYRGTKLTFKRRQ